MQSGSAFNENYEIGGYDKTRIKVRRMMRTCGRYLSGIITVLTIVGSWIGIAGTADAAALKSRVRVSEASYVGSSGPLWSLKPLAVDMKAASVARLRKKRLVLPKTQNGLADNEGDASIVQDTLGGYAMPAVDVSFDGVSVNNVLPPDTQGDIGHDPVSDKKYYVQWVNLSFQIWDVTNPAAITSAYGPAAGNTLWAGTGTICASNNDGDPITQFDHLSNRWMMSQFALSFPDDFHQCIAVSKTADPTGEWYLYDFKTSSTLMNDYPHFGVWSDGYYMSVNQFTGDTEAWAGAGVAVFERSAMLNGQAARMIYIDVGGATLNYGGMLPSDLDGPAPPTGTPNYFMEWDDSTWLGDAADSLRIWEFHADWNIPANSTFGLNANYAPNYMIATANVDPSMCNYARNCIPQPGTTAKLDAITDRLMYRLQYRDFGSYQVLVGNHTVDASGADKAGIHWFEVRDTGAGFFVNQQGVYAPAGTDNRWMGSVAMDVAGDIALGYSVASTTTYPSVRYTGRLSGDALGTLPQGEAGIVVGAGSQTHSSGRWGDYSMLAVDSTDGCTFWYTQEYYATTSSSGWKTRIGSFRFPSCTTEPTGTIAGTVTDGTNPISGATVETTGGYSTSTDATGHYQLTLAVGSYDVTAKAFGYSSATANGVQVLANSTTTQNHILDLLPTFTTSGTVKDTSTGWPLYARIDISSGAGTVFTDPVTGVYSVELPSGSYSFSISAMSGGYITSVAFVSVSANSTKNFVLSADLMACSAPGYTAAGYSQHFETWPLADWTIVNNVVGLSWNINTAYGDANFTGGSGFAATVDSDANPGVEYDTELRSPLIDPVAVGGLTLTYKANFQRFSHEALDLDIKNTGDTGWTNISHWITNHGVRFSKPGVDVVVDLTPYVTGTFQLRWRYYTPDQDPWDWYAQIDEVKIGAGCETIASSGIVVGAVQDALTNAVVPNATVKDAALNSAVFIDTSDDPNVPARMYIISLPAGAQTLTASAPLYATDTKSPTVILGGTVRQDFLLPAGRLTANPDSLTFNMDSSSLSATLPLALNNDGGKAADYEVRALSGVYSAPTPVGPFAEHVRHCGPKNINDMNAACLRVDLTPRDVTPLAAGDVTTSWASGLVQAWGIGYNTDAADLWLSDQNDRFNYRFLTNGTATGDAIDIASSVVDFGADMTYNPFTNMLWQVNVGGDNCIYEMDPAGKVATGNKICPAFGTSERGLAFDARTETYYAGSWTDGIINHFASDGTILDSKNVNLNISGLAFNSATGHLFVMTNAATTTDPTLYDIYVLDTNNSYAILGGFNVMAGGVKVFDDLSQAGLEIDCNGTLWAVNQDTQMVYAFSSGETGDCNWQPVPWLSVTPTAGSIGAGGSAALTVQANVTGMTCGASYQAYLRVINNTPYGAEIVPVTLNFSCNVAPTLGTVTPVELTSAPAVAQRFSAIYSDANGYGDLKYAYLLINTTAAAANSIYLLHDRTVNKLYLFNDAGTATVGNCTPGVAGSLSNTQGTLNCAATTVTGSGNDLTVNWNITPSAAFASSTARNLYLYARDMSNANVGWTDRGDWTIKTTNVAPTLGSVTPAALTSAPGMAQTFSAIYSDADGYSNLQRAYFQVNTSVSGVNCINLVYDRLVNKLYLYNDAGTGYVSGSCIPGAAGSLSNTQGTLNCAATTVTGSGNDLTVKWNITPSATFASATARNLYLAASEMSNAIVGWTDKGDWTIKTTNVAPTLGTVTPAVLTSAPGMAQTFSAIYSDADGYANLQRAYFQVNTSVSGANCINLVYDRLVNRLYLYNDAGTAYVSGNCIPGAAGNLSNTQGTLNCAATTVTGSGNDLTVKWNITPSATFASATARNLHLAASEMSNAIVGWTDKGDWTIKATNVAPTLGSVTPAALTSAPGMAQTFSAIYSDADGYSNLQRAYFQVNTSVSGVNCINLVYDRLVNKLYLYNDAGTGYVSGSCMPGAAGSLSNTQGTLNCAATTVTGSGNDLTLNWNITPSATFASATARNLHLAASEMSNAVVGWTDKGDWTIKTTNVAPTLGTVTPAELTSAPGMAQTFSAIYSDADGYANLQRAYFQVNTSVSGASCINLVYDRIVNKLYLYNDAGTGYVSGSCIPGEAGSLSNTQGTLNCAATTVTGSGNSLTIKWNITPSAAFVSATARNLYMDVSEMSNAVVGWMDKGDWTIKTTNVAPTLGTVTPAELTSAPGMAQTFSAIYSDADGYSNLQRAYFQVNTSVSGVNCINLVYDRIVNKLYLYNDAGTGYVGGSCIPGEAGSLSNAQGTLNCAATTVTGSGNSLTIKWNITPSDTFVSATARNLNLAVSEMSNAVVGWMDKGDWTIKTTNVAPTLGTVTPAALTSAPGMAQTFSAIYSDADGYSNLQRAYFQVNTSVSGVNCINLVYDRLVNRLYLYNDAGTGYISGSCIPGAAGSLSNTQGTLNCAATTVTGSGNDLTVKWNIAPSDAFVSATAKNLYLAASEMSNAIVGWMDKGDWTIKATNVAPTLGTVTPAELTSAPGMAQTFSAIYSDADGYSNLQRAYFQVNTSVSGVNCINLVYDRLVNKLYLYNDAGTGYVSGSCMPGAAGSLSNTQGTLNCAATTVTGSGNDLTIKWNITPSDTFVSATARNLNLAVSEMSNAVVGWMDKGDWTIKTTNVAPTLGTVTPAELTSAPGMAQTFSAIYSDADGYSNLQRAYFQVNTSVSGVNCINLVYDRLVNKLYLYNDAGTGYVSGSCIPGAAGSLSNTQGTLNCAATTVTSSGNNLTVNWNITPSDTFVSATARNLYLAVSEMSNAIVGWTDKGDWTINIP